MDPDRSDGPDPPDPGSAAEAAAEEEDAEAPKVVEWDELQEELARLWSLSSAAHEAKERKDALTRRIESILKSREESLRRRYELEDMRQKLNLKKTALEDLRMRVKKASKDVEGKREQLCLEIRTLLVAAENLSTAQQQLQEANKLLAAKMGHDQLKNVEKMIRMKQQYLVAQVAAIYPVEAINEQSPGEKPDLRFGGDIGLSSKDVPKPLPLSSLTILGLQLTMFPKMSIFGDEKELQNSATVLGYVAHAVSLIASYLNVRLRYPLRLGASRSYILDHAPSVKFTLADVETNPPIKTMSLKPTEFPLFLEGQDAIRAAYAIFLLNKDLEQLLNYVGAESLGPRHVLANLWELIRIILSEEYINN
ncbi:UV radiation resistance-associated gene protein-like isoform X1 [Ananas comosus]|uniref:UV radiation resistance-associated gene protein-like isoform X1 n=1 Tax=Ananas comosus TaxID=4615 RepID=A0A6P5H0T1_ANACO|nr:UV radiation resistance-associated gene protein-like isoform X1 [Ananas comosus]